MWRFSKSRFTNDLNSKILKLLKCGFNGDKLLNNIVWKYANVNQLKTVNDELPTDELYNDILKQIDKTDICENIKNENIKNKDREILLIYYKILLKLNVIK